MENALKSKAYKAGDAIYGDFGGEIEIGMVKEGVVFTEITDSDGIRRILDICIAGDWFIAGGFPVFGNEHSHLTARTKCTLLMSFETDKQNPDSEAEIKAEAYIKAWQRMTDHACILGQNTLRKKINAFIGHMGRRYGSKSFRLEISYSDMADFIGADRSAMMRELKKMEDEVLIKREGKLIEIIQY